MAAIAECRIQISQRKTSIMLMTRLADNKMFFILTIQVKDHLYFSLIQIQSLPYLSEQIVYNFTAHIGKPVSSSLVFEDKFFMINA